MKKKYLFIGVLLFFAALQSFSQGSHQLKIGIIESAPPFCYKSEYTKEFVGVDIEVAKRIFDAIRKKYPHKYADKIKFEAVNARQREDLVLHNRVDFIVAVYSVTQSRVQKGVHFSLPYYKRDSSFMIMARKSSSMHTIFDLKGRTLGFVGGSIAEECFKDSVYDKVLKAPVLSQSNDVNVITYSSQSLMWQAFQAPNSQLDAIMDDYDLIKFKYQSSPTQWSRIELPFQIEDKYAVGIPSNHFDDSVLVNQEIKNMLRKGENGKSEMDLLLEDHPNPNRIDIKSYVLLSCLFGFPILALFLLASENRITRLIGKLTGKKTSITPPPDSFEPANYAWIIANSKYDYITGLNGHPYQEAENLKSILGSYDFKKENVVIQKDLSRKAIIKGFHDLALRRINSDLNFATRLKDTDNLLIYFSGHGEKLTINNYPMGFWVPKDGSGAELWSNIPDYEIKSLVNLVKLNQILLISDSCFAGTLIKSERAVNALNLVKEQEACIEIITSGIRRVPAESEFAAALVSILKKNTKEEIYSSELHNELVSMLTRHDYTPQFGSLGKQTSTGNFVFRNPSKKVNISEEEFLNYKRQLISLIKSKELIDRNILQFDSGVDERVFNKVIERMQTERLIIISTTNKIKLTQYGKNFN